MKATTLTFALVCLSLAAFTSSAVAQGKFVANAKKSQVSFVSEAPAEKIVGNAKGVTGTVTIGEGFKSAEGVIQVPVKNLNTGNKLRDRHLKGKDWLNAKKHPNIAFKVTGLEGAKVEKSGNKTVVNATAVGSISINGVAKETKAPVVITTITKGEKTIAKVALTFKVALADHKVAGKKGVVGNKVGKTIDIKGTVYGAMQ